MTLRCSQSDRVMRDCIFATSRRRLYSPVPLLSTWDDLLLLPAPRLPLPRSEPGCPFSYFPLQRRLLVESLVPPQGKHLPPGPHLSDPRSALGLSSRLLPVSSSPCRLDPTAIVKRGVSRLVTSLSRQRVPCPLFAGFFPTAGVAAEVPAMSTGFRSPQRVTSLGTLVKALARAGLEQCGEAMTARASTRARHPRYAGPLMSIALARPYSPSRETGVLDGSPSLRAKDVVPQLRGFLRHRLGSRELLSSPPILW